VWANQVFQIMKRDVASLFFVSIVCALGVAATVAGCASVTMAPAPPVSGTLALTTDASGGPVKTFQIVDGKLTIQPAVQTCMYQNYSHYYPGETSIFTYGYNCSGGTCGVINEKVIANPIPHSTAFFTPNPVVSHTTYGQYNTQLRIPIGSAAPPGNYDVTSQAHTTATAKPTAFPTDHNCVVVATPPGVVIQNAGVTPLPFIQLYASPASTAGKILILMPGQALYTTPSPGQEPNVQSTTAILYQNQTGWDSAGQHTYQFRFSTTPLPTDQATIPPGRYSTVIAEFSVYGGYNDPKTATTSTPLPCYNLSNDVINPIIAASTPTTSLQVILSRAKPSPIIPIMVYSSGLGPPNVTAEAFATGNNYPTDALIYWWQEAVTNSGQPPVEILFHELDHHFYEAGVLPFDCTAPSTFCAATLTLGKTVFMWNLKLNKSKNPPALSQGYLDFEHLLIHNDVVRAFGADQITALAEAFDQASPIPNPAGVFPTPTSAQWSQLRTLYNSNLIAYVEATPTPIPTPTPSPTPTGATPPPPTPTPTPTPKPTSTPTPVPGPALDLTCNSPQMLFQVRGNGPTIDSVQIPLNRPLVAPKAVP
jgi:hypothetical protein